MMFRPALALAVSAAALTLAGCNKAGDTNGAAPADGNVAAVAPPAGQTWTATIAKTPEGGMMMGNPNAPIKLVEYGSRTCPHCAKFDAEGLPPLRDKYVASGKVSYEFRDYPVHGPIDVPAILLGHCVEPATFFPLLDQMMRNQEQFLNKMSSLDQAKLTAIQNQPTKLATTLAEDLGYIDFMKQHGVPEDKARACLNDQAALEQIAKSTQEANAKYNISGTPTFILNGKVLQDTGEWPQVEQALKAAGA